jgi:hypothetical protein
MDSDGLIPLFAIFCIFGLPVVAWMFFRLMAHRERMEMLRQGFLPGSLEAKRWTAGQTSAPPPGRPLAQAPTEDWSVQGAATLRKGITLTMIGFAITLGLSFIGYHEGTGWHPGPWLLGGLIPMFVGIAQVLIGLMSGATLGPQRVWTAGPPPPLYSAEPPIPPSGSVPTYDSSYTYRPGDSPELRPPSSPPERR